MVESTPLVRPRSNGRGEVGEGREDELGIWLSRLQHERQRLEETFRWGGFEIAGSSETEANGLLSKSPCGLDSIIDAAGGLAWSHPFKVATALSSLAITRS